MEKEGKEGVHKQKRTKNKEKQTFSFNGDLD